MLNAQILHDEVAIALEARALRNRRLRRDLDRLVDRELLGLAALGRPGALVLSTVILVVGIGPLGITIGLGLGFHSARFELRLCLLPLEHGDLVAHLLDDLSLPAVLPKQILKLYQQLLHQRAALRFGNARQLFEIGHRRIWTVDDGDIWKVTLTHPRSSLIYLPRLIE